MPTIRLRVVDQVHDGGGNPVHDAQGRPVRNGGTYHAVVGGVPRAFFPGEVVEMEEAAARRELEINGATHDIEGRAGRLPILELESDYLAREARRKDAAVKREEERDLLARTSAELQREREQHEAMKRMIRERDAKAAAQPAPDLTALMARLDASEGRAAAAERGAAAAVEAAKAASDRAAALEAELAQLRKGGKGART